MVEETTKNHIVYNTEESIQWEAVLHKKEEVLYKEITIEFDILWDNKHKALYAYGYARDKWLTYDQWLRLVAQIHRENGTWNETRRWDAGCSVWLTQWNECARWPVPHKDWEGQIRILIDAVYLDYIKLWDFIQAQVAWNSPKVRTGEWNYTKTKYFGHITDTYSILFNK